MGWSMVHRYITVTSPLHYRHVAVTGAVGWSMVHQLRDEGGGEEGGEGGTASPSSSLPWGGAVCRHSHIILNRRRNQNMAYVLMIGVPWHCGGPQP